MSVFPLRPSPSLRWIARTAEPFGQRVAYQPCDGVPHAHTGANVLLARGSGIRATRCGLALPDSFALKLGARTHATPRNPVTCPLEESALRQWCVRRQSGVCPECLQQAEDETPPSQS